MDIGRGQHPVSLTPQLRALIASDDPDDPIARQFVRSALEDIPFPEALDDPIGDRAHSPLNGIIHRYPDRLLLNLVNVCPAYCRFCFRRGRVGHGEKFLSPEETQAAFAYIQSHTEIWEVILSGGEPLLLPLPSLRKAMRALAQIDHVKTLRLHTRAPITIPEKMTDELISTLLESKKPVTMLLHCNHARELSSAARRVIGNLQKAGVSLFSQSVLLKGVNDNAETLEELMRQFLLCGIKPHYLHHPDLVHGTRHFHVSLDEGIKIVQSLRGRLSGLCQPRYMLDIPEGAGKVSILDAVRARTAEGWRLTTLKGDPCFYKDPLSA